MKKNGVKSASRMCLGVLTIQLREKAIVESPTYDLAASADLSTSGYAVRKKKVTAFQQCAALVWYIFFHIIPPALIGGGV